MDEAEWPEGVARGAMVTYSGSRPEFHGEWIVAGPCPCFRCGDAAAFGLERRLCLVRGDGMTLRHVHPESVSVTGDGNAGIGDGREG